MSFARTKMTVAAVLAALVVTACGGNPPDKEIQQAQGAIDTARAAGAPQYSPDEFGAAEAALKKANDAVTQRDYRQALSFALDARDRAQTSVREAADRKAVARVEADRALRDADDALHAAGQKLKSVEGNRTMARPIAAARTAIASGEDSLKSARTAFERGEFAEVSATLGPVSAHLKAVVHELDAPPPTPSRPRKR